MSLVEEDDWKQLRSVWMFSLKLGLGKKFGLIPKALQISRIER